MSTQRKTHYDIALYGLTSARALCRPTSGHISAVWKLARRNRTLCEQYGHNWRAIRRECVTHLRRVDATRKGVAA